ncbi:g5121 [Coccomyxa elongata]
MASDVDCEAPSAGTSYPITLGETFLSETPSQSYCSLRYDFKPASAGRLRQGSIQLQDNQATVNLPDTSYPGADMSFSGRHEHSRDGLDCVAIFDGVSWRLELVRSQVKGLKATRRAGRLPTPPPPALELGNADMADDMADDLLAALEEERSEASPPASSPPVPQPQSPLEEQPLAGAKDEQDMDQEAPQQEDQFQEKAGRLTPSADAQMPKQPAAAMGASDMSEMEREFMRAPDDSSDESDDDEEALNQCSDDDSELAPEDF